MEVQALTEPDGDIPGRINIYLDPTADFSKMGIKFEGQPYETPLWLVVFHELGGHAYLKHSKLEGLYSAYNAIKYENQIRAFHNLGVRAEDDMHPNLLRR